MFVRLVMVCVLAVGLVGCKKEPESKIVQPMVDAAENAEAKARTFAEEAKAQTQAEIDAAKKASENIGDN